MADLFEELWTLSGGHQTGIAHWWNSLLVRILDYSRVLDREDACYWVKKEADKMRCIVLTEWTSLNEKRNKITFQSCYVTAERLSTWLAIPFYCKSFKYMGSTANPKHGSNHISTIGVGWYLWVTKNPLLFVSVTEYHRAQFWVPCFLLLMSTTFHYMLPVQKLFFMPTTPLWCLVLTMITLTKFTVYSNLRL